MRRSRRRPALIDLIIGIGAVAFALSWPVPAATQRRPSMADLVTGYSAWLRFPSASRPTFEMDLDVARSELSRLAPTFLTPLEGVITDLRGRCPEVTFRLGGSPVSASADTAFDDAVCGQLFNGERARAYRQPAASAPLARLVAPLPADALNARPAIDNGRRRLLATVALELAAPGSLRQSAAAARLVEWACELVRAHTPPDDFDRAWQLAALSILEGGINAKALDEHMSHLKALLPDEPRLTLARAIVEEQSTAPAETLAGQSATVDAQRASYLLARTAADHARAAERAITLFRSAASIVAVRAEASLRLGHVQLGMNRYDDALASFADLEQQTADRALIYMTHLFRGLAFEGLGRPADARSSYDRALEVSPRAHSATMRQAALAFRNGRHEDADTLLKTLLADNDPYRDPWWAYYAADWRFWYPRIEALRTMLRPAARPLPAVARRSPALRRWPDGISIVPARQNQVFSARSDAIMIQTSVKSGNRPVSGLTAADFELRDNGVAQVIDDVWIEQVPLDLTLLLDLSTSVDGATLVRLKTAVRDTAAVLRPDDRVRLIAISQVLQEIVPLQAGGEAMPLDRLTAEGATSLYDGLAAAMMRPTDPGRRQLVLALSDGRDSTSIIDEATAESIARLTDVVVDLVVPVGPDNSRTVDLNVGSPQFRGSQRTTPAVVGNRPRPVSLPIILPKLVAQTAGEVLAFTPTDSISSVFKSTLDDFRAAYVLRYVPQGVSRDGWHDVVVTLKKPGKYDIRARKGYSGGALDQSGRGAAGARRAWGTIRPSELIR